LGPPAPLQEQAPHIEQVPRKKHGQKPNMDRFSDDWVSDYCMRESTGSLAFEKGATEGRGPLREQDLLELTAGEIDAALVIDEHSSAHREVLGYR